MNKKQILLLSALLAAGSLAANAQGKPSDTEFYEPVPPTVTAGKTVSDAPSDAIILFDGKNLDQWTMTDKRGTPASWTVADGAFTVNKRGGGNIETVKSFGNYQLHIEWRVPANITGKGQGRGNSGIFLASLGKGDAGYELQVLDSYENPTYVNGQAGSIYKQFIPLANASKKPGEWQTYDVIWTAPTFEENGDLKTPARVTVLHNGVLIQNNITLEGPTQYIGKASYKNAKFGPAPIKLQSHGDPSEPLSFRNIWVRELK